MVLSVQCGATSGFHLQHLGIDNKKAFKKSGLLKSILNN